uniref:Putative calpain-like cysteine peptidase n=1 Tax=Trypanosoma congolense (strain IL3000) TaxID=1068625 RepID=G0UNS9_TRYCI|nr:putative calpain-like cysteine peptidase [Trypanosoma congolense IL3000]
MVLTFSGYSPREVYEVKCRELKCKKNSALYNFLSDAPDAFKSITTIDVSKNFVGPRGVLPLLEVVRFCENLHTLDLRQQELDKNAIDVLCLAVKGHARLVHLNLSANPLDMSACAALLELARVNSAIRHISLDGSAIRPSMMQAIEAQLERNRATKTSASERAALIAQSQDNRLSSGGFDSTDMEKLSTVEAQSQGTDSPSSTSKARCRSGTCGVFRGLPASVRSYDIKALLATFSHSVHDDLFDENPINDIAEMCVRCQECFHDENFSMDIVHRKRGQIDRDTLSWRRVEKLFPSATLFPDEDEDELILPSECFSSFSWIFICVGASFKSLGSLRQSLQCGPDINCNVYSLRVHVDGKWRYVIVDGYLPVNDRDELIFTKPVRGKYFWPCILEKALAKLNGSYSALYMDVLMDSVSHSPFLKSEAGSPKGQTVSLLKTISLSGGTNVSSIRRTSCSRTLQDLSGGVGITRFFHGRESKSDELWSVLVDVFRTGAMMIAIAECNDILPGIEPLHAYRVDYVQQIGCIKLIKIHSPWAQEQWKGDWSEDSVMWQSHQEVSMMLRKKRTNCDYHGFWISYVDFLKCFGQLHTCHVFDGFAQRIFEHQWDSKTAGGPCHEHLWHLNPHFKVEPCEATPFFINLSLPDARFSSTYVGALGLHVFNSRNYPLRAAGNDKDCIIATNYVETDSISVEGHFHKGGKYWVIPSSDTIGITGKFILRIFVCTPFTLSTASMDKYWYMKTFADELKRSGEYRSGDDNAQVLLRFCPGGMLGDEGTRGTLVVRATTAECPRLALGMFLLRASMTNGQRRRIIGTLDDNSIVASSTLAMGNEVCIETEVSADEAYTLVTCVHPVGSHAKLEYTLWSSLPLLEHSVIPLWKGQSVTVSWLEGSGSFYDVANNPQVEICPHRQFDTFVISMRIESCSARDPAIVFFVVENDDNKGECMQGKIAAGRVVLRSQYVQHHTVQCELRVTHQTDSLLVIPCLQPTGSVGTCTLTVSTESGEFSLKMLSK